MSIVRITKNVSKMLKKPEAEVRPIIDALFADINGDLVDGKTVIIHGFGRFVVYPSGRIDFVYTGHRKRKGRK